MESLEQSMPSLDTPVNQASRPKHSGMGIASFIMAISAILLYVIGIVIVISAVASVDDDLPSGMLDSVELGNLLDSAPQIITGGMLAILSIIIVFVGVIFGIIGLVQRNRKKVFAVLGTTINGLFVALTSLIIIVALVIQSN